MTGSPASSPGSTATGCARGDPGPAGAGDDTAASLALPAEALLRLVYGRLDSDPGLRASGVTLPELKSVFPGF